MSLRLKDLLPTAELVENTPVVELAGCVLRVLRARLQQAHDTECLRNFVLNVGAEYGQPGRGNHKGVMQCCAEAWDWLYVNGFIGQHGDNCDHWFTLTRKGRAVADQSGGLAQWAAEQELPEVMLHMQLRGAALRLFRQGLLDTAVFEAFKALEVAIRDAAGLGHDAFGLKLVAKAFDVENGPLTDLEAERGERTALLNLMSGALGSYKNPHSHRRVEITAAEARELLLLASHLLRIVESRRG